MINKGDMKNSNSYGKGRIDVINEMINFCYKKIRELDNKGNDTHKNATLSGLYRGYKTVIQELNTKKRKTEEYVK